MGHQTLDASALIAYYAREPGWKRMAQLLVAARDGREQLAVHAVNVGEVYYLAYRRAGYARAIEMLAHLRRLPVRIHDRVPLDLLREAGRVKALYPISYADAFAVALARLRQSRLVTTDRGELGPLEKRGEVRCLWLR